MDGSQKFIHVAFSRLKVPTETNVGTCCSLELMYRCSLKANFTMPSRPQLPPWLESEPFRLWRESRASPEAMDHP